MEAIQVTTQALQDPRLKEIVEAKWLDFLAKKYGEYEGCYSEKDGWEFYQIYLPRFVTERWGRLGDARFLWFMMEDVKATYCK